MNFSAGNRSRKWACGGFGHARAVMVTIATALVVCGVQPQPARAAPKSGPNGAVEIPFRDIWGPAFGGSRVRLRGTVQAVRVPLPRPRPAEAPATESGKPAVVDPKAQENSTQENSVQETEPQASKPVEPTAPATAPPSACRQALTEEVAIAPSIPDIHGPGGCGGEDLVRLEAIVLPDKHRVSVKPPATLRCAMAAAVADWVRSDIVPLAAGLGSEPSELDNFDSFECRGRNRVVGAPLSEHGRANALDVRAFRLADGRSIGLTDRGVARDLRERVLHSVCSRFVTVLGPGSDGYHEEHVHLDLMPHHNNYRICEWDVWDPLPQIAPLLPIPRPEEAPPRPDAGQSDAGEPVAAKPGDDEPATATPPTTKPATKKRR